jgi:hypothetical protein
MFLQIGHLYHQGPKTAELNILVDTCETINESMIQLVLQIVIILHSNNSLTDIGWLQWLVILKSLIMASKGPAEDFLSAKWKRKHRRDATTELYHKKGFGAKLPLIG